MIPASDLWMLGLRSLRGASVGHMVPTRGAAQPLRDIGEMSPDWAARAQSRLTVGVTCSLHWGSARRRLAAFREARPEVDLVVVDLLEGDLAGHFEVHRIDVAIAPEKAALKSCRALPLWHERLIAALPETSPLAQANAVSPTALRAETLLLAGDVTGQGAFQRAVIAAIGGQPAAVMHYPVERDTLFDLVALGVGITVCPGATTGAFYPGVCFRPIDSDRAEIGYSLLWTEPARDPVDVFIALAEALARKEAGHGAS